MDYSELFSTEKQKIIDRKSIDLKNRLIEARKEELNYNDVLNDINSSFYEEFENHKNKNNEVAKAYEEFGKGINKYMYGREENTINCLNKHLYSYYNSTNTGFDSYPHLLKTIAKIEALRHVKQVFSTERQFFEDMYDLNDFKHFTLDISNYPYSDEWKKLYLKRYPPRDNNNVLKYKKDYTYEINQTKNYLAAFDDEEKAILLKAFYSFTLDRHNHKEKMQKTEFIKVVLIISKFKEPDIFYMDKASDSNLYNKVKSSVYSPTEKQRISNIVEKLRSKNISVFADYLSMKKIV